MATVFANSALMMGPLALSVSSHQIRQAEEASRLAINSVLMVVNPAAAVSLNAFQELTRSGVASHPLFPANDNQIPANQEAVDAMTQGLTVAKELIDQKNWDEAIAVLEAARKDAKEKNSTSPKEIGRYQILFAESAHMKAFILLQQGKKDEADTYLQNTDVFSTKILEKLGKDAPERAEALLVRAKIRDLAGNPTAAKADFEAAAKIDPSLQPHVAAYEKQLEDYAQKGEKLMLAEAKKAAAEGLIPEDKIPSEVDFNRLSKDEKISVLQNLFQIARLEKMRIGANKETDPTKKLYLEGQVALTDGNLPLAQLKMVAFKAATKDSEDAAVLGMRDQVRLQLQTLAVSSVVQLEQNNEALIAQRRNNPEKMLSSAEPNYRRNKNYLAALKTILQEGRADTLEEAQEACRDLAQYQRQDFLNTRVIGAFVADAYLPYKKPATGSEKFEAEQRSDRAVVKAYGQPEFDSALLDPNAFPDTAYVRLEGGSLRTPQPGMMTAYPGVVRVVVGKEGGEIFTMDGKRVSFPASDTEKVVLLKGGQLDAKYPLLERNKDFFEQPVTPFEIGFVDDDFPALLKLHTSEGWEKMQTPEERRGHLLSVAKELRNRDGSYAIASELLEEILAPQFEGAVNFGIATDEKEKIAKEVEGERYKTKTQVLAKLKDLPKNRPSPSDDEINAMVDAAQEQKLAAAIKIAACGILRGRADAGTLGDETAQQAWDVYNDMNDFLNEPFNISSETWDRIADEAVVTAVTMPLAMGAGRVVKGAISGTQWIKSLETAGRLGHATARGITYTGVAATESFVQQTANLHLLHNPHSLNAQLKAFGWNMVMSFAFHGGNSAWSKVAAKTGLEKNVLANLGGSFATPTAIASGFGEFEIWLHDADAPGSFFERVGGHGLRMVGNHYGTQAFHLATSRKPANDNAVEPARIVSPEPKVIEPVEAFARRAAPAETSGQKNLEQFLDPSERTAVEDFLISKDPAKTQEVQDEIERALGGNYEDLSSLMGALRISLEKRGLSELRLLTKISERFNETGGDEAQFGQAFHTLTTLMGEAAVRFLPDNVPVYRTVSRDAVVEGANGSLTMKPNHRGMSFWAVGNEGGPEVAKTYGKSLTEPHVLIKSTLGELRRAGDVAIDRMARTGNALELRHADSRPVRGEIVADSRPSRELPKPLPRPAKTGATATSSRPAFTPDLQGTGALGILAERGGVGIMAQTPRGVADFFRREYGDSNFKKIEFLLESNDISRARILKLRSQVAEKAGRQYSDLETARQAITEVLKEEGIDFTAWRAERKTLLEAEGKNADEGGLDRMHKDVLDGVLLLQLLPNEVPVYRTTGHAGQAGQSGSSWWGFGESGKEGAATYWNAQRVMVRSTVGDLRKVGIVRSDEMPVEGNAVSGNSLELYHAPTKEAGKWTPVPHEVIRPSTKPSFRDSAPTPAHAGALYSAGGPVGLYATLAGMGLPQSVALLASGAAFLLTPGVLSVVFGRKAGRTIPSDPRLHASDGQKVAGGFFKADAGPEKSEGRFVHKTGANGATVAVSIEGKGLTAARTKAAEEAQRTILDALEQGRPLYQALSAAQERVSDGFVKQDGTLLANAPAVNTMAVALQPLPQGGYQALFLGSGSQEAVVIRLGSNAPAIFQTKAGLSSPERPLQSGDVIVAGRLSDVIRSTDVAKDIVRRTEGGSADVVRDAFLQEALIRAALVRRASGQQLTHRHYTEAYQEVMGHDPEPGFRGYYEGGVDPVTRRTQGYLLKPNGDVVDATGKVVDHFTSDSPGIMVQIVGE